MYCGNTTRRLPLRYTVKLKYRPSSFVNSHYETHKTYSRAPKYFFIAQRNYHKRKL